MNPAQEIHVRRPVRRRVLDEQIGPRREAPPSPQMSNPVVEKASRRDPDEQLEFQGGELR